MREDSEDKRWRNRGGDDELLRTIWVAEERRRLERKEREGILNFVAESEVDEEEEEDAVFSSSMRSVGTLILYLLICLQVVSFFHRRADVKQTKKWPTKSPKEKTKKWKPC